MGIVEMNMIDFVRESILKSNKSIQEWADDLSISRQTIYDWLNKDVNIRQKNVYRIAKTLEKEILITNGVVKIDATKKKEETTEMDFTNRVIETLLDDKKRLLNKIEKLNTARTEVQYQPHPEAFNAVADGLENITKQWNWAFYHNSKPMSCSRDDTIRAINPALEKIIEWTEDELRGKSILDLVHKDDKEAVIQALSKVNRDLSIRVKKKNGNYCLMHVVAKEFGTNGKRYSIGLLTCVEKDCPDCDSEN